MRRLNIPRTVSVRPSTDLTSAPGVLLRIFSYACTDYGQTGCSLLLVCKLFNSLCNDSGIDIQCAAVCGLDKLRLFFDNLARRPAYSRAVDSLFLTYRDSAKASTSDTNTGK